MCCFFDFATGLPFPSTFAHEPTSANRYALCKLDTCSIQLHGWRSRGSAPGRWRLLSASLAACAHRTTSWLRPRAPSAWEAEEVGPRPPRPPRPPSLQFHGWSRYAPALDLALQIGGDFPKLIDVVKFRSGLANGETAHWESGHEDTGREDTYACDKVSKCPLYMVTGVYNQGVC